MQREKINGEGKADTRNKENLEVGSSTALFRRIKYTHGNVSHIKQKRKGYGEITLDNARQMSRASCRDRGKIDYRYRKVKRNRTALADAYKTRRGHF